jgi:branched-chain amino acid transport system substrate-binding protein
MKESKFLVLLIVIMLALNACTAPAAQPAEEVEEVEEAVTEVAEPTEAPAEEPTEAVAEEPTEPPAEEPTEAPAGEVTEEPDATEPAEQAQGEPYRIGVFFSETGPASSLGIPERDTALMIAEQVNAAGGILGPDGVMHPLELIIEDDQSDATEAVLIVTRFIEEEGVPIIVGGTGSPASLAVIDTVTEAEVPFISNASASDIIEPVEERFWVFKTPQTNLPVSQVQADWMEAKGITRVASLGVNNAFGADSIKALNQVAEERGIEIVYEGTFEPGDTDFSAQLTQVAGSDAEALVVHATPGEGAPLTVQFRDLGMEIPVIHNHGIGNPTFIELAGDAAEGVLFPIGKLLVADALPEDDPQREVLDQYIADYSEFTDGAAPSSFGGHAWDAMQMAIMALEAVGPDPAAIREYLETIQNFAGISGVFNLSAEDHNGIGKESLVLVEIQDGDWSYVPPESYAEVP